jgi:hypothetical protein
MTLANIFRTDLHVHAGCQPTRTWPKRSRCWPGHTKTPPGAAQRPPMNCGRCSASTTRHSSRHSPARRPATWPRWSPRDAGDRANPSRSRETVEGPDRGRAAPGRASTRHRHDRHNYTPHCASRNCVSPTWSSKPWPARHPPARDARRRVPQTSTNSARPPPRRSGSTLTTRSSPASPAWPTTPEPGSWPSSATIGPTSPTHDP